jgi:hypothetical protein
VTYQQDAARFFLTRLGHLFGTFALVLLVYMWGSALPREDRLVRTLPVVLRIFLLCAILAVVVLRLDFLAQRAKVLIYAAVLYHVCINLVCDSFLLVLWGKRLSLLFGPWCRRLAACVCAGWFRCWARVR